MKQIDCYLLYTGNGDIKQTVEGLQATGRTGRIIFFGTKAPAALPEGCGFLPAPDPFGSRSLKAIAAQAEAPYTLLYTKDTILYLGLFALERMAQILEDSGAGMAYADHYQLKDGRQTTAPVIDYQQGSLRDDFDFGSVLLMRTDALKEAAARMKADYRFAGLYDLRLKLSQRYELTHINEYLYTEVEQDTRRSGEKIFDYVDPKNRDRQTEMEAACMSVCWRRRPRERSVTSESRITGFPSRMRRLTADFTRRCSSPSATFPENRSWSWWKNAGRRTWASSP